MSSGPCKDCTERKEGCHDRCSSYISWKKEHLAEKEWLKQKNLVAIRSNASTLLYFRRTR